MGTSTIEHWSRTRRSELWTLAAINGLLAVQLLAAVVYGLLFGASIVSLHIFLLPFVWITVSVIAVYYTDPVERGWKPTLFAGSVASGYLLLFLWLSGSIGLSPSTFDPVTGSFGFGVEAGRSFGWGPVLYYSGEWLGIRLIPYQVIGYAALAYLVYAAVIDVTRSATAGTIGLILCPGCAAAVVTPVIGGIAGLSSAVSLFVRFNYEIATVLFVVAMGLLYWQPSLAELRQAVSSNLSGITGGFAVVVAGLHLFHPQHGLVRLIEFLQVGTIADPRPIAFTLSGIAILLGIALVAADVTKKPVYLLGMGAMLLFLSGYVAWHTALDHGAFWPHIEAHGHHDQGVLETVAGHLLNDGYALASKLTELIVLALLVVCYRRA